MIIDEVIDKCKISSMSVFYKKHKKDNYKLISRTRQVEEKLEKFEDRDNMGRLKSSLKEIIIHEDIERKNENIIKRHSFK